MKAQEMFDQITALANIFKHPREGSFELDVYRGVINSAKLVQMIQRTLECAEIFVPKPELEALKIELDRIAGENQ